MPDDFPSIRFPCRSVRCRIYGTTGTVNTHEFGEVGVKGKEDVSDEVMQRHEEWDADLNAVKA